jgi:hypothetical protein
MDAFLEYFPEFHHWQLWKDRESPVKDSPRGNSPCEGTKVGLDVRSRIAARCGSNITFHKNLSIDETCGQTQLHDFPILLCSLCVKNASKLLNMRLASVHLFAISSYPKFYVSRSRGPWGPVSETKQKMEASASEPSSCTSGYCRCSCHFGIWKTRVPKTWETLCKTTVCQILAKIQPYQMSMHGSPNSATNSLCNIIDLHENHETIKQIKWVICT